MTLKEKITQKVAERKAIANTQDSILAENTTYVNYLVDKEIEATQVIALDTVINKLNAMKPIITSDGSRYAVHCYPISESNFGPIGSRLLAIATIAPAMFTTERQIEFTALTNVSYLIALDASHKLGKPAYVNKEGEYIEGVAYDDSYELALTAVAHGLGLDVDYAKSITTAKLDRWFESSKLKALAKIADQQKSDLIDDTPFTLED